MKYLATVLCAATLTACVSQGFHLGLNHPSALSGEWIDTRHAMPADTSLWVLRPDGYDGTAHLLRRDDGTTRRTDRRYGGWYLEGSLDHPADHAICFAKRVGRDGGTCLPFTLDTVQTPSGPRRRLLVRGYEGEHTTGDRILIARDPGH